MKEALRKRIRVGKNGHIEIPSLDLPEGTEAELVILVNLRDAPKSERSILDMFGAGRGIYGNREEIDAYIEEERNSWE